MAQYRALLIFILFLSLTAQNLRASAAGFYDPPCVEEKKAAEQIRNDLEECVASNDLKVPDLAAGLPRVCEEKLVLYAQSLKDMRKCLVQGSEKSSTKAQLIPKRESRKGN